MTKSPAKTDKISDDKASAMRHVPRRANGQRRVTLILDVAERLFEEVGYEAATTNEIAAQANTSIGSLYQFFPNKDAILYALAERYTAELSTLYDAPPTTPAGLSSLTEMVGGIVEIAIQYGSQHPVFTHLVVPLHQTEPLKRVAELLRQEVIQRFEYVLEVHAPELDAEKRHLNATIGLTVMVAVLRLAIENKTLPDYHDKAYILQQLKALLGAFFETLSKL